MAPGAFMLAPIDSNNRPLRQFRDKLQVEVETRIGKKFPIRLSRDGLAWDFTCPLVPILTPGFFDDAYCGETLTRFLELERQRKTPIVRVLCIIYVECPFLRDKTAQPSDFLISAVSSLSSDDWSKLRFKSYSSQEVKIWIAEFAKKLDAMSKLFTDRSYSAHLR